MSRFVNFVGESSSGESDNETNVKNDEPTDLNAKATDLNKIHADWGGESDEEKPTRQIISGA